MLDKSLVLDWLVFVLDAIDIINKMMKNQVLLSAVPLEFPEENWLAGLRLIYIERFLIML